MSGEQLPFPRGGDSAAMLAWARAMVTSLTRRFVSTEQTIGTVVEPIREDQTAALESLESYANDVQAQITAAGGFAQGVFDQYQAAAQAAQAALAQSYLTEAANRLEQHVRISEDEVRSTQINTVAAYLAGSSATITDIEEAVANGEEAVASKITTVQSQANGNAAALQTIQSSAGGTDVNFALIATANGQVKAAFNLQSGAQGSNITFIADRFIIAHPSDSGALIVPFVVGPVDGVPTVGINGNLVVDGTILARHIATATLSAIAADIGEVTAGVLKSADDKFVIDLDNKTIEIVT